MALQVEVPAGAIVPRRPLAVRWASRRGVFYGWIVLAASFLVSFTEMATYNPVLSLFILPMGSEFGWSRSEFSAVVLIATIAAAIVSPLSGRLIDQRGPRVVLVGAAAFLAICLGALAFTQSLLFFYVFYAGARIMGTGGTGIANTAVLSSWFIRRRSFAMGLMAMAWRIGGTILPLSLAAVIAAYGWRTGWLMLGVLVAVVAIMPPLLLTIRRPEDVALLPDGAAPPVTGSGAPETSLTASQAMKTPALWLIAFACLCSLFTGASYNLHLVPYLVEKGYSPDLAVSTLAGYGFAGVFATLGFGWLGDRIGVRASFIIAYGFAAVGSVLLFWLAAPWMVLGFVVLYGLAFGGVLTLQGSVWATYFGRGSVGTIRGITMPIQLVGNALGPFLSAVVYDATGSYEIPFFSYVIVSLLGAAAMFFARKPAWPVES